MLLNKIKLWFKLIIIGTRHFVLSSHPVDKYIYTTFKLTTNLITFDLSLTIVNVVIFL